MLVLGIESSCDETAAAVVADGHVVRSNVIASQALVHAAYGGVVPEVASRQHLATVVPAIEQALADAGVGLQDLDGIAVTHGPGLVGALLVGVETAKALAYATGKPLVGVHHLAGHMAAARLNEPGEAHRAPVHPHLCLVVSGGHTALYLARAPGETEMLSSTRDDAAGEAFDKVAKVLGLGYPGGVRIDQLAAQGDAAAFDFPRPLPGRDELNFSFSGLKTAVDVFTRGNPDVVRTRLADVCASFQAAVVDVLARKTLRARDMTGVSDVVVCGGVAANRGLRARLGAAAAAQGFTLFLPPLAYCTDNAAMIAAEGTTRLQRGQRAGWDLAVDPSLPVT